MKKKKLKQLLLDVHHNAEVINELNNRIIKLESTIERFKIIYKGDDE